MNTPLEKDIDFFPVTQERLADLTLFSQQHGKFRYCSCMRWRLRSSEFSKSSKQDRIMALEKRVSEGVPIGILAYKNGAPVGWCSVAPRETYAALLVSKKIPPVDDLNVWSIVCFFVDRAHRRQHLTLRLLSAAVDYALSKGAPAVEGYPVPPDAPSYTYMGSPSIFLKTGFRDVTPPGQERMVMRYIPISESKQQ